MKQISLASSGFELSIKRTRKREFLDEMNQVIPWQALLALLRQHAPDKRMGRPPFALETMLRIHLLQQFFGLSDPAMEEALHDLPLYREFAQLDAGMTRLPDESTILRFRHFLETHQIAPQILSSVNAELSRKGLLLRQGSVVDATLIAAPSSTKNQSGQRDPDMHQTQKGKQWYFGMKAHIGVDADSGLVHSVTTTAANAHDVTQAAALLHGQESDVFADSGYRGVSKRDEVQAEHPDVRWHVAMMPGQRRLLDMEQVGAQLLEQVEQIKARIRFISRAPLSGHQAAVRLCQDALPGAEEEHAANCAAVCAGQFVEGAQKSGDVAGMSASAVCQNGRQRPAKGPNRAEIAPKTLI